jgi:hypothetical protein
MSKVNKYAFHMTVWYSYVCRSAITECRDLFSSLPSHLVIQAPCFAHQMIDRTIIVSEKQCHVASLEKRILHDTSRNFLRILSVLARTITLNLLPLLISFDVFRTKGLPSNQKTQDSPKGSSRRRGDRSPDRRVDNFSSG